MPTVNINVNGQDLSAEVEEKQLLFHFLRDDMDLTGTHVGCDTNQCGACVVHLEGKAVKSYTMLAVQANQKNITTIEGIADGDNLHPVQEAFRDHHVLQYSFCTPGMIMAAIDIINRKPNLDEKIITEQLQPNLCRCTPYQNIMKSILAAANK
jgi:Aerobic-type carbon monoxide dehydrogenase, small subunit CoxS/CutS homologs